MKHLPLAARIKAMKPGEQIVLQNKTERQKALDVCRALWLAGAIPFKIETKPAGTNGKFIATRPI